MSASRSRSRSLALVAGAASAVALLAAPGVASAQSAVTCGTGYSPAEYQLKIGVDGGSVYPLDPVGGHLAYSRYDNMIKHTRRFVANKYVNGVTFNFSAFQTESGWDKLNIMGSCSGASCTTYHSLSGSPGLAGRSVDYASSGQSLQSSPLRLQFQSDATVTDKGIDLSSVSVKCFGAGVSNDIAATVSPGETVDGVLLGANDIVYLALPGGFQPGYHQSVVLWANDATTDMDLLLACGRRPTASDFDLASRTGSNNEYIEWTDATRGACNTGWFLGVHSYGAAGKDGKGFFHVLFARHKEAQHIKLKAAFTTTSCPGEGIKPEFAQRAEARTYLASASAYIYGATDGQVFVDWDLYNATGADNSKPLGDTWMCGGASCDVRLAECFGGGQSYALTNRLWIGSDWHSGNGGSIIHEFGHAHLGLGSAGVWPFGEDGYYFPLDYIGTILPSTFPTTMRNLIYNVCGHSAMSNGFLSPTAHKYCTSHNHMRNQRYVKMGWETNVLTTNGKLDADVGAGTVAYSDPIAVSGVSNDWTPALHSLRWSGVSDWQVAMHHGVFWYEPDGSDDPYEFGDFNAAGTPGFAGKVTDR